MNLIDISNLRASEIDDDLKEEEIEQFSMTNDSVEIYTQNYSIIICSIDGEMDLEIRRREDG